jgi:ubiquitin-protein ligase E3 A
MENDDMELDEEEKVYELDKKKGKFYYLNFPWAFDAGSKSLFLQIECKISRKREIHSSIRSILDILEQNFYLSLAVDRNNLVEDSLNGLLKSSKDLKKPLKVKFKGEPGIDAGGVQKEFFQLLVRELFDVHFGMFDYNEESRLYWFK